MFLSKQTSPRFRDAVLFGFFFATVFVATQPAMALTGRVKGVVRDATEQTITGLTLRFSPVDGGPSIELTTDKKGRFSHSFFPTGAYSIELADEVRSIQWLKYSILDASGVEVHSQAGEIDPNQGVPPLRVGAGQRVEFEFRIVDEAAMQKRKGELQLAAVSEDLRKVTTAFEAGDMESVLTQTSELLRKNPDVGAIHYLRGMAQARAGNTDASIASLRRAIELSPEQEGFEGALGTALIQHGKEIKAQGREEDATAELSEGVERVERELQRNPESIPLRLNAALALQSLGRVDDLIDCLRILVERDSENQEHRLRLIKTLTDAERFEEGFELLRSVSSEAPSVAPLAFNIAVGWFNTGMIPQAIEAAELGLKHDPMLAEAHQLLGMAYLNSGDTQNAISALTRFLELRPDAPADGPERELLRRLTEASTP